MIVYFIFRFCVTIADNALKRESYIYYSVQSLASSILPNMVCNNKSFVETASIIILRSAFKCRKNHFPFPENIMEVLHHRENVHHICMQDISKGWLGRLIEIQWFFYLCDANTQMNTIFSLFLPVFHLFLSLCHVHVASLCVFIILIQCNIISVSNIVGKQPWRGMYLSDLGCLAVVANSINLEMNHVY